MELNDVLRRVRLLTAQAEHEGTSPEEAAKYHAKADALMLKYAIDEAMLDNGRPEAQRAKAGSIAVALTGDSTLMAYMAHLAEQVAFHCNCKIRTYHHYDYQEHTWISKVYGFESDLRWFEIMYTTLRLHMVGALRPGINPALSLEENVLVLHSAGQNWFDIAKMYGWRGPVTPYPGEPKLMYVNDKTNERLGWSKAIAQYKRAYQRAIEARGENWLRVPPSGGDTFRRSSAEGYARRIAQRLLEIREHRQVGGALALRDDEVLRLYKEDNPDLFQEQVVQTDGRKVRAVKYTPRPFSQSAYDAGKRHADGANINPAASRTPPKEVH